MERKTFSHLNIGSIFRRESYLQLPVAYDASSKIVPEEEEDKEKKLQVKKLPYLSIKALSGKLKPVRKKLRRGGTAAMLGLSVTLAGLFNSPSDLMQQQMINNLNQDYAVEYMIDEDVSQDPDDKKKAGDGSGTGGIFGRAKEAVRSFIMGLPQGVKACVCIPFWAAGYAVIYLVTALLGSVVSPAVGHLIGLAMFALILLGVYVITMKCLFPGMPLRKILSFRNIMKVLIGALVLKALDIFLPVFWQGYGRVRDIVLSIAGVIILGIIIFGYLRRRKKHRKVKGIENVDCR